MDRTNSPINSILEQAAHIVRRKKETTGTLEPTESYKRGQRKKLIDFANYNNLWISLSNLNVEFLSKGGENEVYTRNKDNIVIKLNNFEYAGDDLENFFIRINAHNKLFGNIPYQMIGFAYNSKKEFCAVLIQPYILAEREATEDEIAAYMVQFFNEYNQELTMVKGAVSPIAKSVISQLDEYNFTLPIKHLDWTHNLVLIKQVKDIRARYWYMVQSITNHWTTRYLQEAIKLDDYGRHGALANNFTETLPIPEANDVKSMLKDPYIFDMLTFTEQYNERDVEIGLVNHVEKFLVEMGAGFAFMGRQYHIEVSGDDYYIDILMYNAFLHRYLVIELKDTEFIPEYIGKLNFYCSAVDDILCREGDNRTIGLLLCKGKDRIKAEYALRDIQKPIGISDYELGQALPKDFRGSLPTIEEIEKEFESDR